MADGRPTSSCEGGPRPNLLVIGAARSGTTALSTALAAHRDIFFTTPKQTHFLANAGRPVRFRGPGDDITINRALISDPSDYRQLFAGAGDLPIRGEGSASTLYWIPEDDLGRGYFQMNALVVLGLLGIATAIVALHPESPFGDAHSAGATALWVGLGGAFLYYAAIWRERGNWLKLQTTSMIPVP